MAKKAKSDKGKTPKPTVERVAKVDSQDEETEDAQVTVNPALLPSAPKGKITPKDKQEVEDDDELKMHDSPFYGHRGIFGTYRLMRD